MIMPFVRLVTIYVVVILVVVAVFNRDRLMELAGVSFDDTEQTAAPAVEATTGKQDQASEQAPSPDTAPAVDATVAADAAEATVRPAAAKAEDRTQAPSATPPAQAQPAAEAQPTPTRQTQPAPLPIMRPTADPDMAQTDAPDKETPPAPAASNDAAGGGSFETRLDAARRAFWEGDLQQAEALFVALAAEAPDDADVNGELGNVYFAQRRFEDAAKAYLAAGKVLVAGGRQAQAMQLVNVLQGMSPDRAAELRATMNN